MHLVGSTRSEQPARTKPSLPMPNEHGAWGILAVSFLTGLAVSRSASWASLLLGGAGLTAMLGRRPLLTLWRSRVKKGSHLLWGLLLPAASVAAAAVALWMRPDLWPPIAIIGTLVAIDLGLSAARLGRTSWGEIPGIAGLALASTLAHGSATDTLGADAYRLGVVTALYFLGSIPFIRGYVRARAAHRAGREPARKQAFPAVLYYLLAVNVLGALGMVGWMPKLAIVALVPSAFKAIWLCYGRARLDRPVSRIGVFEVYHSLVWAALAWVAFTVSV